MSAFGLAMGLAEEFAQTFVLSNRKALTMFELCLNLGYANDCANSSNLVNS